MENIELYAQTEMCQKCCDILFNSQEFCCFRLVSRKLGMCRKISINCLMMDENPNFHSILA